MEKINYKLLGVPSGQESDKDSSNFLSDCLTEQEAIQRLQALLSEWLRMENLVVLTAAGCSLACRGKTMNCLEEAVLNTVEKIPDISTNKELVKVIQERHKKNDDPSKANWAKASFEQWLSYLVNSVHLAKEDSSPVKALEWKGVACKIADVEKLVGYISKAIYAECALTLPDEKTDKKNIAPHLTFLSKLMARDSNLGRTHLFTLNYDTLFEQAIELLGIQYFDGFSGRANARFDPSVYGLDIYYPGEIAEGKVRRFDKFLHFYKLHGSIHWQMKGGEIRALHRSLDEYSVYQEEKDAKAKAAMLVRDEFAPNYKKFGILPTSNKFVQTLDMPYSHLFRAFQARLSAPQTFLMVLGYGFGDEHVNRIIDSALMNPALVMLVVEPNPNSSIIRKISRYTELGKRAFVLTASEASSKDKDSKHATFDDFAKRIMPDVQWLDDFLKLRRFEKQLQKDASELQNSNTPTNEEQGAAPQESTPQQSANGGQ